MILEKMEFPEPVIKIAVEPKTKGDNQKMSEALVRLAAEDPSFRFSRDEESGQVYFKLQQQRLIELIRQGKVEEALGFAHQYLAPRGEENVRPCALEQLISQYRLHAEMHVTLECVCVCMLLLSARVR